MWMAIYRRLLALIDGPLGEGYGSSIEETFERRLAEARAHGRWRHLQVAFRECFALVGLAISERRGWRLEIFLEDARYALRGLVRAPGFTLAALVILGLGIGANTAIYQLFDAVSMRSLPVPDAQELAIVELADASRVEGRRATRHPPVSNPVWQQFRSRQNMFRAVLAWGNTDFSPLRLGQDGESLVVRGLFVSGEFFSVLGVDPFLGRTFTAADDQPGCGLPGTVLSHSFWQRHFGGDPAVIGTTVLLNSEPVPVIGVSSEGFSGVEVGRPYDLAVPICSYQTLGAEEGWLDDGMTWWLTVMGRLPADGTLQAANAALAALSPSIFEATLPADYRHDGVEDYLSLTLRAVPGEGGVSVLRGRYGDPLVFLLATTGLVLLLASTTLANLILARSSAREHELALRRAIGASSARLVRQSMLESTMLAAGGAAGGLLLAHVLNRVLLGFLGGGLSLDLPVDLRLVVYIAAVAALVCLTFGVVPAWRASRPVAVERPDAGRNPASGRGFAFRKVLVVSQVALSLVLVFGAVLFTGTLANLLAVDLGFDAEGVLVARVDHDALRIPQQSRVTFKQDLLDRIRSAPGVASAAEVRHVPMGGTGSSITVWLDGADPAGSQPMRLNRVSAGYLQTMGIPLIAGRDFGRSDLGQAVAIVNRTFAGRLGLGEPVGARFRVEGWDGALEIVGVVPDTKYFDLREDFRPIAFVPTGLLPDPRPHTDFMIRSTTGDVAAAVRRAIREVSPQIRADIRPFDQTIRDRLLPERLMATLAGFFGALAALIAAVGLYGVMSSLVQRRRSEIGVRMALGSTRVKILAMVLRQAATLLGIGCAAGSVLALAGAGMVRSLVFGLEPRSISAIGLTSLLLGVVATAACCIPAARAASVAPRDALRNE